MIIMDIIVIVPRILWFLNEFCYVLTSLDTAYHCCILSLPCIFPVFWKHTFLWWVKNDFYKHKKVVLYLLFVFFILLSSYMYCNFKNYVGILHHADWLFLTSHIVILIRNAARIFFYLIKERRIDEYATNFARSIYWIFFYIFVNRFGSDILFKRTYSL